MSWREGRSILALHRAWHRTSCEDRILGRHATRIAHVLMGKHKPTYHPAVDAGDYVIVEDATKIKMTGKSATKKTYFKHTGFPGSEKFVPISEIREKDPGEILRRAVKGMLPKNSLRKQRLDRLKIYDGAAPPEILRNVLTSWRDVEVNQRREEAKNMVVKPEEAGVDAESGGKGKVNDWGSIGMEKVPRWKLPKQAS